jgi:hypothetical protein
MSTETWRPHVSARIGRPGASSSDASLNNVMTSKSKYSLETINFI